MGVCYSLIVDGEIEQDDQGDGKSLARAAAELAQLSESLGVAPLESFVNPACLAEFVEEMEEDVELPSIEDKWYPAAEGLATVQAYLQHLRDHPDAVPDSPNVIEDLQAFEEVLKQAVEKGLNWQLLIFV